VMTAIFPLRRLSIAVSPRSDFQDARLGGTCWPQKGGWWERVHDVCQG
jgi:hypothetical protein